MFLGLLNKMYSNANLLPGNEKSLSKKMSEKEALSMKKEITFFRDLFGSTEEPLGGYLDPEPDTATSYHLLYDITLISGYVYKPIHPTKYAIIGITTRMTLII